MLGDNSVGVRLGDVSGNVRLAGTITANGQGAIAVRSTGNVSGRDGPPGLIVATGYRFTTAAGRPEQARCRRPVAGRPGGCDRGQCRQGVILAVAPKDNSTTDNDEDDDGIEDAKEGNGSIASYGSAAALRIGSSGNTTIGASEGTGTGFGLIVDGGILGDGVYTGVDGNALQIGGQGGTVSIANGIGVTGTIQAKSLDRNATAVRLGVGASTPELRNAGKILATSGTCVGERHRAGHRRGRRPAASQEQRRNPGHDRCRRHRHRDHRPLRNARPDRE